MEVNNAPHFICIIHRVGGVQAICQRWGSLLQCMTSKENESSLISSFRHIIRDDADLRIAKGRVFWNSEKQTPRDTDKAPVTVKFHRIPYTFSTQNPFIALFQDATNSKDCLAPSPRGHHHYQIEYGSNLQPLDLISLTSSPTPTPQQTDAKSTSPSSAPSLPCLTLNGMSLLVRRHPQPVSSSSSYFFSPFSSGSAGDSSSSGGSNGWGLSAMFGSAITSNDSKEESKETQQLAEAKHQQFMEETKNGSATTNDGKNVDVDVRVNLGSFIDGCEIKYVLQQIVSQLDSSKCGTNDVLYGLKRDFPATMPMVNRLFKFQSPFLSFLRPSSPPLPTARPTPSSHLTHVHICFPINLKELRKEHPNMAYILSQVGKVDLCVTNRDESKLLARVAVTRRKVDPALDTTKSGRDARIRRRIMRLMSSIKDFNLNDDENRADVMRRSSGMGGRTRASSAGSADGRSRTSSMDHDLNNTGYDADAADEKDRDSDSHMKNKKVFVLEVHALCQGENLVWQERRERKESNSNTQTLPAATPPPASQYMHNGLKKTDSDEAWEATWVPAVRGGSAGVGKTFDASANPDIDTDAAKKSTVEYDIFDFDLTKQGQDKLKLLVDLNVLLFGTFVIALPLIQLHLDVSTVQRAKDESSVTTFSEIVISLGSQIEVPGTTRFGLWMLGMSSLMEQLTDTLAFRIKMLTTRSLAAENKSTDADIGKNDDADAEADANLVDTLQADKRTTVAVDNAIVAFMKNEAKLRGMRLLPSLCCVLGNVHCTKGEVQLETLRQQSKSALKAELEEENADDLVELSSTFLNAHVSVTIPRCTSSLVNGVFWMYVKKLAFNDILKFVRNVLHGLTMDLHPRQEHLREATSPLTE